MVFDMFRLVVLALVLLCTNSQPVKKKTLSRADLARTLDSLQKQIKTLKDALQVQKDAEKEAEVQHPDVKKKEVAEKTNDAEQVNDLLADLEKAVQDEATKVSNTKRELKDKVVKKEPATSKLVKDSAAVAKVVVENDKVDILSEKMRTAELQLKRKDELKMKKALLDIRDDLHQTRDSFIDVEKHFGDGSLDSSTVKKVDEVRRSLKDVMGAVQNLKADVDTSSKWKFHEYDGMEKRNTMIKDVKMKLKKVNDAIKELSVKKKDEKQPDQKKEEVKKDDVAHVHKKGVVLDEKRIKTRDQVLEMANDLVATKNAFVEMKKDLDAIARDHPAGTTIGKEHIESIRKDMSTMVEQLTTLQKMVDDEASETETQKRSANDDDLAARTALLKQMKAELKDATENMQQVHNMVDGIELHDQAKREMENVRKSVLGIRDDFHQIKKSYESMKGDNKVKDPKMYSDRLGSIGRSLGNILKEYKDLKSEYFDKNDAAKDLITSKTSEKVMGEIMGKMRDQLGKVKKDIKDLSNHFVSNVMKKDMQTAKDSTKMKNEVKKREEAEKDKQMSGKEKNIGTKDEEEKEKKTVKKDVKKDNLKVTLKFGTSKAWEDAPPKDETSEAETSFLKEMEDEEKKSKREEIGSQARLLKGKIMDVMEEVRKVKKEMKESKSSSQDDSTVEGELDEIKMKLYDIQQRVEDIHV